MDLYLKIKQKQILLEGKNLIHFQNFFNGSLFNPIQNGPFWGCSRIGEGKIPPLSKICHTYPTMMKLNIVIPYLKKIQKIYELRERRLEFC